MERLHAAHNFLVDFIGAHDDNDAPCAKRRCDKISAQLKRFTISGDDDRNGRLDMDTDSEDDQSSNDDLDDDHITGGVVEEPAEDEQSTKLHLNDCLQRYLEHMKQSKDLTLPSRGVIRGNELIVWRPLPELRDPFSDPSMKGRIQEVDSAEDTGEGMFSPRPRFWLSV
ncbi:unnamed protein product [Heligmosomoides polygyrus]|uniref:CBP80/20-dependent translation initiation factor n=1 Tax=Heligmosomoides polygyrus TaxID=6339 RepID=A0A183GRX3_HELPZ|nr:unnamed protein product [Heligmosomoides polygyrus]